MLVLAVTELIFFTVAGIGLNFSMVKRFLVFVNGVICEVPGHNITEIMLISNKMV